MKKFYTLLSVSFMLLMVNPSVSFAQISRPGQTGTTTAARPGHSNVRPGSSTSVTRPGATTSTKPGNNKAVRPGTAPAKPSGNTTTRPGTTVTRPGTTNKRPVTVTPPSRPNRLPAVVRPVPTRPANWRPGTVKFRNTILGLTFGSTLSNSLDYLYNSSYSVDGYGTNEVYLRNVKEFNYTWTDATLYYQNGMLAQSVFYESTIGDNTSRYYGVYNRIRSLYGNPSSRSTDGRNMTSSWWGANGEYITLEYSLLRASGGYRYYTILTIGR